jgi:UDP-N-acetylglucosamine 2-epimerase (non-hydrolysing)
VEIGTNHLAGTDLEVAYSLSQNIFQGLVKKGKIPDLWDGKASDRIVRQIIKLIGDN